MLASTYAALSSTVPIIDIGPLFQPTSGARQATIEAIGDACRRQGFFYVINHQVDETVQAELEACAKAFFALPRQVKRSIEMSKAGSRWRGYFEVGEEFTSGIVDEKEGLYFAAERPGDTRPLHGANLFHSDLATRGYMESVSRLSRVLLEAIAASIGLTSSHFGEQFADPTTLFRIFHYPPHDEKWGDDSLAVGEHSDYGYLTVLKQDGSGGLQVKVDGEWIDAPPVPNSFVCNLGDALEHNTGGLLRATPHRVVQRRGARGGRLSFPFFFDPSFHAKLASCYHLLPERLREQADERRRSAPSRWDGRRVEAFEGTYGDYLLDKVKSVFPELSSKAL